MHAPPDMEPNVVIEPDSPAWRHAVLSHDIDEFAGAQPSWSLHYEQLSSGPFTGSLRHVQLPGLRMVHEQASCATWQRGELGGGHIGFAMPLDLAGHAAFNGQALTTESIMIGRSEQLDLCLPADAGLIAVVVDAQLLGTLWEHLYQKRMSAWFDRQVVVAARPGLAESLRRLHLRAMADAESVPGLLHNPAAMLQLRDAILIEWIEALPTKVGTDELASGEARKRVVDRACELMLAQRDAPLTILQVCDRIGASPRKLEYCFRSVLGIAPAKYMRAARLNGVRRELRRGGGAVQDVASRWGFWHMGEFAAAYRRQFGELPSHTLRQAS
ncbi:MAG TPA: helix-turn-helix domain-containing protein [Albitalea sp.]|nr:helix-turn-helix domain-containing protein [Albitalea sp.]